MTNSYSLFLVEGYIFFQLMVDERKCPENFPQHFFLFHEKKFHQTNIVLNILVTNDRFDSKC